MDPGRALMTAGLDEMALQHSCLARQLAEVEVIRAMYPQEGEFSTTEAEATAMEILATMDDETPFPDFLSISFTLHLLETKVGGRLVSVGFSFPRKYPETEAVRVTVDCGGKITKHQHEILTLGPQSCANRMLGEEAVFQVLQTVQELAVEIEQSAVSSGSPSYDSSGFGASKSNPETKPSSPSIHRKLIWFHHIKSSRKRKDIIDWSSELRLGGFCKPGFPGVLITEGEANDVAEYVRRIQRLRWQALQIRGEEEEEVDLTKEIQNVDSIRRFPVGVRELPESGMSELAGKCREVQLEELFLTALKISR